MSEQLNLPELFDALVDEVGGELDVAIPRLTLGNPLSSVGQYVMEVGYTTLLAQRRSAERARLKVAPIPSTVTARTSKRKVGFHPRAQAAKDELFNTWMLGNTPLGAASRTLLLSEAEREVGIADGHHKNAQFYRELADLTPEGQTVSQAVDISTAHEIRARIYKGDQRTRAA